MENTASTDSNTPPPALLPRKIMRRGEDGGSGHASTSPSKATSEVGSDGKEKPLTKEKLTREEREEAYKQARERIFGKDDKTGESNDGEGVSRASSVSGKDRSNVGKRNKPSKQRRDDSESFDSRSQYTAYYGHPHQPTWTPQYIPIGNPQYNGQMQPPYPNTMPQMYPAPSQPYPQVGPANGYPQYGNMQAYPPQPQPQPQPSRYPPPHGPKGSYGPPMQPSPHQAWQPPFNAQPAPQSPYQNRPPQPQAQGSMGPMGNGIPYAYGQLPVNANPNDPKSQHPIPGSYNRHAFNPKTQSFVPGNGMSPVLPPLAPYSMGGPHGSPQVGSPHMAYSGYASPNAQAYMGGPGYGMSRQGSNNSLPPYHQPQHIPQLPPAAALPQMPSSIPNKPGMSHQGPPTAPGQTFSHLPTYGNPATLPQKPPAGI